MKIKSAFIAPLVAAAAIGGAVAIAPQAFADTDPSVPGGSDPLVPIGGDEFLPPDSPAKNPDQFGLQSIDPNAESNPNGYIDVPA